MKTSPMSSCAAVLALISIWAAKAATLDHATRKSRSFLSGGLQPEVVAKTLARVQDEWFDQARAFADCHAKHGVTGNCQSSQDSFGKSCTKVVDGIVQGSSGDQNMVREYMGTVCAQKSLSAVHHEHCVGLRQAIDGALQFNAYSNLMHFNPGQLCTQFWSTFADAEKKRAETERAAEKEMLIKANERAKALAEKRQQEEAHEKALEAQRQALEATQRAAQARKDATERLARKKAEAIKAAAAAKLKVAQAAFEAAKAAEEHKQRQLEHEKAEEHLRNLTMAHKKASAANATAPAVVVNASVHSQPDATAQSVVISAPLSVKTDKTNDKIIKAVVTSAPLLVKTDKKTDNIITGEVAATLHNNGFKDEAVRSDIKSSMK